MKTPTAPNAPPVRLEPGREISPYYVRGPRGHARPEVFGPGGEVFREGGDEQEQAVREWLWHLENGRIG